MASIILSSQSACNVMRPRRWPGGRFSFGGVIALVAVVGAGMAVNALADTTPVAVLDPNLEVTTVVGGLAQPIGVVFLPTVPPSANDMLVLEKASGRVKRVISGVVQPTLALDLAVNSNSERGLLSLVLHPDFPAPPWPFPTSGCDRPPWPDENDRSFP